MDYSMEAPQKTKELPIPLLGITPDKTIIQKDTCTPMFTAALFKNSQDMETIYMSINRWLDKKHMVPIHNGYSTMKKNKIMPFAVTQMQLDIIT